MVKVRNRSLFILLLLAAGIASPAMAEVPLGTWLAQLQIDNPDAIDDPDAPAVDPTAEPPPEEPEVPAEQPVPVPAGEAPPELAPNFMLPDQLPAGTNLTIEGSSSMEVITRALLQRFQQTFPDTNATLIERPSGEALANLLAGTADLAAIGRPLTDEERAQGLMEVSVAREKIAIIVSDENPYTSDLEAEDFVRIFRGEITNWAELGGPDLPIRFIDRPLTSDTRSALGNYEIFGGDLTTGGNVVQVPEDSTAAVVEALGDNGIGYAIASQVIDQDNVRVLSMHNTLPDDPRYPYSQPRNYVYRSTETLPVQVEAFLAFATNATGQEVVAQAKAAEAADVAAADLPDRVTAMRPNGQGFVTGDRSGNLNFWNIDGTSAGSPVAAHTGPVTALAFSPDGQGQRLVSGGADGTIRLWDAVGTPIGDPINAGTGPVTSLVVQPDGSFISANADGSIQRWDDLGNPVGEPLTGHTDAVRDMVLTPDGTTLVTAAKDGTVRRWSLPEGTPLGEPLTGHQGPVQTLAVKPDGTILSGGADGTIRQWDTNGMPVGNPMQVSGPVTAIALNADGSGLAVGDATGALQFFSGDGIPLGPPITDIGAPIDDLAYTPDGQRLVVSAGEAPQIRDSTGQLIPTPEPVGVETTMPGIPPELLDLWRRLQTLPPEVLWIIPVAVLALLLLGLLRSFRQDEAAAEPDQVTGVLPGSPLPPEPDYTPGLVTDLPSQDPAEVLDSSLAKAKQTLAEGVNLGNAGLYQEALDCFNKAIELADMERLKATAAGVSLVGAGAVIARGLARRGNTLANLGRPDEALQSLNRALEMDPNDIAAWIGKGNVLAQMGQLDEALFCFDKAIDLNPNIAAAWQGKGKALQKMGRDAEARSCFAKVESLGGVTGDIPLDVGSPIGAVPPASGYAESSGYFSPEPSVLSDGMRPPSRPAPIEPGPPVSPVSPGPLSGMRPAARPAPIEPGPASSDWTMTPEPPPPPITPGLIGIIETPDEAAPTDFDTDLPADLAAAIANLPTEADMSWTTSDPVPPGPMPPIGETIATEGDPTNTDLPPEVAQALEYLPAEPETPDYTAPAAAPIAVPPEVNDILAGQSPIPTAEDVAAAMPSDPMGAFMGSASDHAMRPSAPPSAPTPGRSPRPDTAIAPDQPDDGDVDPALAGLPPELLEALQSIPADSPDSFDLPSASSARKPPAPPPPPTNPRLRNP